LYTVLRDTKAKRHNQTGTVVVFTASNYISNVFKKEFIFCECISIVATLLSFLYNLVRWKKFPPAAEILIIEEQHASRQRLQPKKRRFRFGPCPVARDTAMRFTEGHCTGSRNMTIPSIN
jgi:hypothetical protein